MINQGCSEVPSLLLLLGGEITIHSLRLSPLKGVPSLFDVTIIMVAGIIAVGVKIIPHSLTELWKVCLLNLCQNCGK